MSYDSVFKDLDKLYYKHDMIFHKFQSPKTICKIHADLLRTFFEIVWVDLNMDKIVMYVC